MLPERSRILWLTGLTLATGTVAMPQEVARPDGPAPTLFIHGTFTQGGDHAGEAVRIVRRGTKQTAHFLDGHREVAEVRWLDERTYQLFDRHVKGGTASVPAHDTVTVHITDTWFYGYSFRSSSTIGGPEVIGTLELVQPRLFGASFGP